MNWDYDEPFIRAVRVLPEHIDALDHTNNTQYVTWCNETAWAHTTALGLGATEYQDLNRAMALTRADYLYLQATRLDDELMVGTWITKLDRRMTMERKMQIVNANSGDTVLRATLQFVCIEISSGRPKRPPKEFIAIYEPALVS